MIAEHGGASIDILQPDLLLPEPFEPLASAQAGAASGMTCSAPLRPTAQSQAQLMEILTSQVARHVLTDGGDLLNLDTPLSIGRTKLP